MSWFGSIVNSLKLADDDVSDGDSSSTISESKQIIRESDGDDESVTLRSEEGEEQTQAPGGVKEDLSEITKTLTRQFWGVASFLAPPPPQSPVKESSSGGGSEFQVDRIDGIRSDFAEIGGRVRSGIKKISGAKAVEGFSKIASTVLKFGLDQGAAVEGAYGNGGAIGVTEEVVAFVKSIAMHPETWLDFPLADDDENDQDDFDMSDAQQEHALAVERLVPELAALRFELCPEYMSEGFFWKIYFVLVHPRLDKHDAEILSTSQIMETRTWLKRELQNRRGATTESESLARDTSYNNEVGISLSEVSLVVPSNSQRETVPSLPRVEDLAPIEVPTSETEKSPDSVKDTPIVEMSVVIEERSKITPKDQKPPTVPSSSYDDNDEDDGDDWLKEETTDAGTVSTSGMNIPIANDEDVSFSDLEKEDDIDVPTGSKKATYGSDSSTKSRDWVQLSRTSSDSPKETKLSDVKHAGSPNKETNDWLDVQDLDEI